MSAAACMYCAPSSVLFQVSGRAARCAMMSFCIETGLLWGPRTFPRLLWNPRTFLGYYGAHVHFPGYYGAHVHFPGYYGAHVHFPATMGPTYVHSPGYYGAQVHFLAASWPGHSRIISRNSLSHSHLCCCGKRRQTRRGLRLSSPFASHLVVCVWKPSAEGH